MTYVMNNDYEGSFMHVTTTVIKCHSLSYYDNLNANMTLFEMSLL